MRRGPGVAEARFLVRTDGRGNLHTHFEPCFSCSQYRPGFVFDAADLRCIACRFTYPLADEAWDHQGACAPIPIHFELDEPWLLIEKRTLERTARPF